MTAPGRSRWLIASVTGHAAVFALLLALPKPPPGARLTRPAVVTELSVEAPPSPAAVPPPPEPVAPEPVVPSLPEAAARAVVRPAPSRLPVPAPVPAPVAPPPAPVAPPTPAPAPVPALRAADLLRPDTATLATALPTLPADPSAPPARALFAGSTGTDAERAVAASQGFVREALGASTVREAPGVRTYLWNVRRRVAEAWRPGVVRVPNLAETLLAGFIAPERAIRILGEQVRRRQQRLLDDAAAPRLGGARDAIDAIGGTAGQGLTTRPMMPTDSGEESWRRNVRTTRAEVLVEQDENGRVLDVRLLHGSGIPGFDRAALEAVRHGVEEQDPMPLPGGRRSRWSFTVVATRRLFTPNIGGAFDESRGWFRLEVPGQVTLRSRVQMEESGPRER